MKKVDAVSKASVRVVAHIFKATLTLLESLEQITLVIEPRKVKFYLCFGWKLDQTYSWSFLTKLAAQSE